MDEEKAILWQQRIQECMSSGLSVKRWCEEKGVKKKVCHPQDFITGKIDWRRNREKHQKKQCL